MNFTADRRIAATAVALPRSLVITPGDKLLKTLVCCAMLLESVVFIEPAPVDAVIVLCLVAGLLSGKLNFSGIGKSALVAISIFALMNLISLYDPFDPAHAIAYVGVTLYLAASWFLFAGVMGRYGRPLISALIGTYAITGLISAALGVGGYFHLLPFSDQFLLNGRARGLFKDCNVYGPFFVPMALFALVRLIDDRSPMRTRIWQSLLFAAALLAMLLSFSRACWVNFGVAVAALFAGHTFLLPGRRKVRGLGGKAVVLAAGALAVVLLLNIPAVHSMFTVRVNSDRLQGYDRVRFATQSLALETAEKHPFGIGPGQSEDVFDYSTHSMYLRILAENGFAALAAILFFIGATLWRAMTLVRRAVDPWIREINLVVLACICGHLVNSFVIDTVHWRNIWFIYALPWVSVPLRCYVRKLPAPVRFEMQRGRSGAPRLVRV